MLISKYLTEGIDISDAVDTFEKENNIEIPAQYRSFLIRYNGGDTPETEFKCKKESSDVRAFYGIGKVNYSFDDIPVLSDFLKKKYLPIAKDSFGNYIVIGLSDDFSGKIFFCDHEKQMRSKLLADSFADFIKSCKSGKLRPVHTRTVEEKERLMIERGDGDLITDELRQRWKETYEMYGHMHQEEVVLD